ncbi:hypothetical protein HK098_004693 [Nowakowskiella sp. JEL0407]|nr:hypothetical protein HK098_004693 [Nowakowskiella sp. JEL0407]
MSRSAERNVDAHFALPLAKTRSVAFRPPALNPYQKHRKLVNDYHHFYLKPANTTAPSRPKTDQDILKDHHKDEDESDNEEDEVKQWESRVAKKYYDRLFKEFAMADMRSYKSGRIALRWRTEKEVIDGLGQFTCANLYCSRRNKEPELKSWEVNFGYIERGVRKNALVKLRLCERCAEKLNYKKLKEKKAAEKMGREQEDRKRKRTDVQDVEDENEEKSARLRTETIKDLDDKDEINEKIPENLPPDSEEREEEQAAESSTGNIWSLPVEEEEKEKTFDEELEDYFKDLFK